MKQYMGDSFYHMRPLQTKVYGSNTHWRCCQCGEWKKEKTHVFRYKATARKSHLRFCRKRCAEVFYDLHGVAPWFDVEPYGVPDDIRFPHVGRP